MGHKTGKQRVFLPVTGIIHVKWAVDHLFYNAVKATTRPGPGWNFNKVPAGPDRDVLAIWRAARTGRIAPSDQGGGQSASRKV